MKKQREKLKKKNSAEEQAALEAAEREKVAAEARKQELQDTIIKIAIGARGYPCCGYWDNCLQEEKLKNICKFSGDYPENFFIFKNLNNYQINVVIYPFIVRLSYCITGVAYSK